MLAITGASGAVGGLVARALADLSPRLVVRDPSRAPDLGLEVRAAEYADGAACTRAFEDVETLFLVSAAESATRREEHRTAVRAAADAGVRHVVYTSFSGAAPDATFTLGRDHFDTEQAVRESGVAFTFLRDNFYLDLLPHFADEHGVIRGPAGDGRVAGVARADVADVAVAVLRDPGAHAGAAYRLTGPEALTMAEIAARAGAVVGRDLRYEAETVRGGLRLPPRRLPGRRRVPARRLGEHLHRDRRGHTGRGQRRRRAGSRATRRARWSRRWRADQAVRWCT